MPSSDEASFFADLEGEHAAFAAAPRHFRKPCTPRSHDEKPVAKPNTARARRTPRARVAALLAAHFNVPNDAVTIRGTQGASRRLDVFRWTADIDVRGLHYVVNSWDTLSACQYGLRVEQSHGDTPTCLSAWAVGPEKDLTIRNPRAS